MEVVHAGRGGEQGVEHGLHGLRLHGLLPGQVGRLGRRRPSRISVLPARIEGPASQRVRDVGIACGHTCIYVCFLCKKRDKVHIQK